MVNSFLIKTDSYQFNENFNITDKLFEEKSYYN